MEKKKIALVTCEMFPLMKVGGLGDVTGSLYRKLKKYFDVGVFLPGFSTVKEKLTLSKVLEFEVVFSRGRKEKAVLLKAENHQYPGLYLIENREYFDRSEPYGIKGKDYPDNPERFSFFCMAVLEACKRTGLHYDVFHCHDWQTALVPLYLKAFYPETHSATVFTIHNLAYQGIFPRDKFGILGLGPEYFRMEELEFYGSVNTMKAGIIHGDVINTVSPTYAKEILTGEYGCGLEGVLSTRKGSLYGILNGIDYQVWNPAFDNLIEKRYRTFQGKTENKKALQKLLGLKADAAAPLFGFVGRLVEQKGSDLIVEAVKKLAGGNFQLAVLGKGEEKYEKELKVLSEKYPAGISVSLAFDEAMAHMIYAGSDFFLMPSRFEPCGLGQIISLKYGTVPVVRKTGGLADTVENFDRASGKGWGFVFEEPEHEKLMAAMKDAMKACGDTGTMKTLFENARSRNYSWDGSADRYRELYLQAGKI